VAEPTSIAFNLRGCGRTWHAPGDLPLGLWRSSAWRHADGSPATTGPRRPFPGFGTARCLFRRGRPSALAACRSGSPRRPDPGGLPRVRHGAVSLPAHAIRLMAGRAPGPRADGSAPGDRTSAASPNHHRCRRTPGLQRTYGASFATDSVVRFWRAGFARFNRRLLTDWSNSLRMRTDEHGCRRSAISHLWQSSAWRAC
jgi:hypothetical protein